MNSSFPRDKKIWFWLMIFFIAGLFIGFTIGDTPLANKLSQIFNPSSSMASEWRQGQQGLINPLLGFDVSDNKNSFTEYEPLSESLNTFVVQQTAAKNADKIGIYFRDLNDGHWTGVNENDLFAPASLIKVPMMMTYYKVSEYDPEILNKKIQYIGPDQNTVETFKPAQSMVLGDYYTVEDLIERMIIYSDNNAVLMLYNDMDKKTLNNVFTDLGISLPSDTNQDYYISPKTFSFFFRTLYAATYLNQNYSEKALEILTRAHFKEGLESGVPSTVSVADKFGENPITDSAGKIIDHDLHDCGIVYYPNHPYFLCVMTTGQSYPSLAKIIGQISTLVYQDVQQYYR